MKLDLLQVFDQQTEIDQIHREWNNANIYIFRIVDLFFRVFKVSVII